MKLIFPNTLIQGHILDVLKEFPSNTIDCVVTSPPYWALRKYGDYRQVWDGEPNCDHEFEESTITIGHEKRDGLSTGKVGIRKELLGKIKSQQGLCHKCGAWKGQLGLEPSFKLYIKHLLDIFLEIKRILKDTGTCWVNIGDSFYTVSGGKFINDTIGSKERNEESGLSEANALKSGGELPTKSLCMIPYRFAIGMQDNGWTCRNLIIWHKPNCMPSSASDRFTVDFEPVFLFTKSKSYYFEEQLEPQAEISIKRAYAKNNLSKRKDKKNDQYAISGKAQDKAYAKLRKQIAEGIQPTRKKRCVWAITTKSFKGAHFATFNKDLIIPMIKAGCPPNGIVLDPFIGSGTTAVVAKNLGRKYLGIDANEDYIEIAKERIAEEK